jgi:formylglycine-generating enzyme required for sulfatase activity
MNTCPAGTGSESCCASLEVVGNEGADAGVFYRTYTNNGAGPTGEKDPATVSSFSLDKYLVTVGRFRQFVTAWNNGSGWMPSEGSGKHTHLNGGQGLVSAGTTSADGGAVYETGWDAKNWNNTTCINPTDQNLDSCPYHSVQLSSWTSTQGTQENLPINCVTWYEAYAFCIWDGGFLPSEAEWAYAAAGGSQQREYAWGSTDPGANSQYAIYNCYYPNGSANCTAVTAIAPVGTASLGVGLWKQLDLGGDEEEWTLDWYQSSYVDPCTDCAYLAPTPSGQVARSGHFGASQPELFASFRGWQWAPTTRGNDLGFRCARAL